MSGLVILHKELNELARNICRQLSIFCSWKKIHMEMKRKTKTLSNAQKCKYQLKNTKHEGKLRSINTCHSNKINSNQKRLPKNVCRAREVSDSTGWCTMSSASNWILIVYLKIVKMLLRIENHRAHLRVYVFISMDLKIYLIKISTVQSVHFIEVVGTALLTVCKLYKCQLAWYSNHQFQLNFQAFSIQKQILRKVKISFGHKQF